ncbi:mct-4, partial [Pristionchus pacificus]
TGSEMTNDVTEDEKEIKKKPPLRTIPTVTISEPPSPEKSSRMGDDGKTEQNGALNSPEDNESIGDSVDQSQTLQIINQDLDMSTYSLNLLNADGTGLAENLLPTPPDGGYGWVIVLAAFMSNLIVDGICNSFSEVKGYFGNEFKSSETTTALIGSLLIAVYLLVGPIVGGLVNKYGSRKVVVAGACISGVAFIISTFATNVYMFMAVYGVLGGVGFGMIYLPAIVVVGYYFETKRAIATGIAVAGSGVGTIIMPKLTNYLALSIGWQGTVYVYGGLIFICALFGLLYRPLEAAAAPAVFDQTKSDIEMEQMKAKLNLSDSEGTPEPEEDQPATQPLSHSTRTSEWIDRSTKQIAEDAGVDDETMAKLRSALSECDEADGKHLSPILENKSALKDRSHTTSNPPPNVNATSRNRKLTMTSMNSEMLSTTDLKSHASSRHNLNSGPSRMSARSIAQSMSRLSLAKGATSSLSIAMSGLDHEEFTRPMNRKDIFYTGSIRNLKEFESEGKNLHAYRESMLSIPTAVLSRAASKLSVANGDLMDTGNRFGGSRMSRVTGGLAPEEELDEFYDDSKCKWIPLSIRTAFADMIDLELLKDPVMMLLCISNILGMMGFYIPFMFLKDLALADKMDSDLAGYLIPIIGVFNTGGRIFFGWLADRGYISALAINNFSLCSCGVLCCICPFWTSFTGLAIYSAVFGFIISAYICLTSIVLSDLLGLEKLTNSFGLLVVARGVASLVGAPFAGMVYDITKSYGASFIFAGALIVVSGVISCFIPFVFRWKRNKGENEGDLEKDADAVSGKLSVLTERSEEDEYQRTIQSLRQQHQLLREIEDEKRRINSENDKRGAIGEADNENDPDEETVHSALLKEKKPDEPL